MNAAQMMRTLWDAARPNLTDEQLTALDCSEEVEFQLRNIAEVMKGIGCLVSADGRNQGIRAGTFQHTDDVPTLLFTFSDLIESQADAALISSEAAFILQERKDRVAEASPAKARKQRRAAT